MADHTDQSTAPLDEKLRRFLRGLADPKCFTHFHYDGFPRPSLMREAAAFVADIEAGRLNVTCGVPASVPGDDRATFEREFPEAWAYWNDKDDYLRPYDLMWKAFKAGRTPGVVASPHKTVCVPHADALGGKEDERD